MRVMVTGGAGYIGSVTATFLQRQGHEPIIVDNLSAGHAEAARGIDLVRADLLEVQACREVFLRYRFDAILHFAASSLVEESVRDPRKYYFNNLVGGLNLVSLALERGVKRFIFSSTAAVYGEPEEVFIQENHRTNPINSYGRTKLDFENLLESFRAAYGLGYVCLRYFNAAGAASGKGEDHRPETHLIPIVLEVALGKRPHLEVYGGDYPTPDGTCIRDYIHVEDLAKAHVLALASLEEGKGSTYNLGNGKGFSVLEVISVAKKVTGSDFEVRMGPRRGGDPARLVASSARISRELGWRPVKPSLEEMILSQWNWMKEHPDGYKE